MAIVLVEYGWYHREFAEADKVIFDAQVSWFGVSQIGGQMAAVRQHGKSQVSLQSY
jgi:hypothetical protein